MGRGHGVLNTEFLGPDKASAGIVDREQLRRRGRRGGRALPRAAIGEFHAAAAGRPSSDFLISVDGNPAENDRTVVRCIGSRDLAVQKFVQIDHSAAENNGVGECGVAGEVADPDDILAIYIVDHDRAGVGHIAESEHLIAVGGGYVRHRSIELALREAKIRIGERRVKMLEIEVPQLDVSRLRLHDRDVIGVFAPVKLTIFVKSPFDAQPRPFA